MGYKLTQLEQIAAPPALVTTTDSDVAAWLLALPAPNPQTVVQTKFLWAVQCARPEGSSTTPPAGTAWVVSAGALRRIRGHRFT